MNDKRYCSDCKSEIFYVNVGFTSNTMAWVCRECKKEVEYPLYHWNLKNYEPRTISENEFKFPIDFDID